MQTTLLGLAIAFIIALLTALIGPYFIDWNQFRPQFEAEATRIIGVPVRVAGQLDARLLPAPTLRLRSVTFGGNNDLGKLRADKLDVEFSLSSLMRGEWRATELTVNGMAADLGLDANGRVDLPSTASGSFNLASLAIERLNLTGRIALHDAASRSTLQLSDIAFAGDVRSLAGSVRGDGNVTVSGTRYPFRVSSGPSPDGSATRLHINVDPGERAILADLEGVLAFDGRLPKFDGALTLAVPPSKDASKDTSKDTSKDKPAAPAPTPWKLTTKLKVDPSLAKFDQIEASFGPEDTALKVAGVGDLKFGTAPLLRANVSARQLDADKLTGKDNAEPLRILPALRAGLAAIPQAPIPAQISFSSEQIMLGGRPLQNIAAELQTDGRSWTFQRLDLRAPGMTQVALNGASPGFDSFSGRLSIESSDPDTLVAWLQGRSEINRRSTKPLRLSGDVTVAANHLAIDKLNAEIEGGAVEGRITFVQTAANKGSRLDAELKADRLDLDAAASFVRGLAGPQGEWPDEARLSLDVGRAILAGQELRPFAAKFGYSPTTLSLEQLQFGQASGVTTEANGSFDRAHATGKLTLKSAAASLSQLTALINPIAPALAARFDRLEARPGPTRLKLDLGLDKNAEHAERTNARLALDLDAPQLKGTATLSAQTLAAAITGLDLDKLRNSAFTLESKLSAPQASLLLTLFGLDRVVAAGEGTSQAEARVSGTWGRPLQLNAKIAGGGLDADAQGSFEVSAFDPKASVNLRVRNANLAPLFGIGAGEKPAQTVNLSSRLTLSGNRLAFDDLDSTASGSHLRGRLAMTLDPEKSIDGEVGLDTLDLVPALAVAIGAAGRDADQPLATGLLAGWRGRIAFQALRGALPGGIELRPFSGTIRNDGQSLALDSLKGSIGGGEMTASIDARDSANGLSLNARIQLANVDATALRWRNLAVPKGRASVQVALSAQGRSIAALTGALAGNGTVSLESAELTGLDPRAFELAIRASDGGQVADDTRLRQLVEPALSAGPLAIGPAQIPFTIRDGRLRIGATTLEGRNARAIVSGGYDFPADQADIRASLTPIMTGLSGAPPEIQLFAAGPPDRLNRTVDLTPLSSWLAVRTIDRETRRLDAIERGEPPPATAALPRLVSPDAAPELLPPADVPAHGREPRRAQPKAKVEPKVAPAPRPPLAVPGPSAANPPIASQQVAPLPPPIEVRPAPGPPPARPKPKPPLVLVPQSNP